MLCCINYHGCRGSHTQEYDLGQRLKSTTETVNNSKSDFLSFYYNETIHSIFRAQTNEVNTIYEAWSHLLYEKLDQLPNQLIF